MLYRICPTEATLQHDLANAAQTIADLAHQISAASGKGAPAALQDQLRLAMKEYERIRIMLQEHQREHHCTDRSHETAEEMEYLLTFQKPCLADSRRLRHNQLKAKLFGAFGQ